MNTEHETAFTKARREAEEAMHRDEWRRVRQTLLTVILGCVVSAIGWTGRELYRLTERITRIEGRLGIAEATNVSRSFFPAEAAGSVNARQLSTPETAPLEEK